VRQCNGGRRPNRLYRPDDAARGALAGGADHRWSLPVTLLATPALLLFADILGRLLVPGELRVSVVSAFIGAPVLIFLVRRRRGGGA
jgi:ABC-type Fe3+-siderophore transport system permease subunit